MRALIQRVGRAHVQVTGTVVGQIGPGLLILVCGMPNDDADIARALATKITKLRIFADETGKMNLSLLQTGGEALIVSQFTLAADTTRGNRPGFSAAAPPDQGEKLYLEFADQMEKLGIPVQTGQFGADMQVGLVNVGPVTIWIDSET